MTRNRLGILATLALIAGLLGPVQLLTAQTAAAVACTAATTGDSTVIFDASSGQCHVTIYPGTGTITLPSGVGAIEFGVGGGDGAPAMYNGTNLGNGGRGAWVWGNSFGYTGVVNFTVGLDGYSGSTGGAGGSGVYGAGGRGGGGSTLYASGSLRIVAGGGGGGGYSFSGGDGGQSSNIAFSGEKAGSPGWNGPGGVSGGGGNAGTGTAGVQTSGDTHDNNGTAGSYSGPGVGGAYTCCGGSGFGSGGGGGGAGYTGGGGGASGPTYSGGGGGGSSYESVTATVYATQNLSKPSSGQIEFWWNMLDASVSPTTMNATNDVTFASSITLTLTGGSPAGKSVVASCDASCTLTGTTTKTTTASGSDGVATFNDLKIVGTAGARTITLTPSGGYPAKTVTVTLAVGAAAAAETQITTSPTSVTVDSGSNTAAVTVQLKDSGGNNLTSNGVSALALSLPSANDGSLTTPAYSSNGRYTSTYTAPHVLVGTNATISGTMTPSGGSSASITDTAVVTVNPGAVTHLNLTASPTTNANRTNFSPAPSVQLLDQYENLVTTDSSSTVTASIASSPGGSPTLSGASVTASSGVATFNALQVHGVIGAYQLNLTKASIAPVSFNVTITPGPGYALQIARQPVAAAAAGAVMTTQPIVEVYDQDGNLATGSTAPITATPSAGGFVGPDASNTAAVNASAGVATFTDLHFGGPLNVAKTLTFSSPGMSSATSSGVTSTATGAAYKLVTTTGVSSPIASGAVFGTQPVITRQDMGGNTVSADPQATVTASSSANGVIVGTAGQPTVAGITTFSGLGLSGTDGTTYTLTFASPGLVSATQTTVMQAGTAVGLSLTATNAQQPNGATFGTPLTQQPKVQIVDTGDNGRPVNGVVVTATITAGTGTFVGSHTATTNASGLASFSGLEIAGTAGPGFKITFSAPSYTPVESAAFTVNKAPNSIANFATPATKTFGGSSFAISATDSVDLLITFTSTTPTVCAADGAQSVSGSTPKTTTGVVTLLGAGTCTIQASSGSDYYATATQSVTFTVNKASQSTLAIIAPAVVTAGQTVTLATRGGSGSGAVMYGTSGVCSVTDDQLTFTGAGDCSVTASKAADTNYLVSNTATYAYSAAGSNAITKSDQTLAFTSSVPATPQVGETITVTASATSGLAAALSVASGSTAVCALTGATLSFTAAGTCEVLAAQAGNAQYHAATSISQTIVVGGVLKNQSIQFAQPTSRALGTPDFTITISATSALPITLTSASTAVCTVTSLGFVHLVAAGECSLTASQPGDSAFAAASPVTRVLQVTAALPTAPFITSVSTANGSVTVSFAAPGWDGGSTITGYRLVATPAAGPDVSTNACAASGPCTLSGLSNDTSYTVKLAAINGVGTGPYSTDTITAQPTNSPYAPTGPSSSRGGTSITLTWSQPSSLGGATFTRYEIYQREIGQTWPVSPITTIGAIGTTSYTVNGLDAATSYDFKIVVITSTSPAPTDANSVLISSRAPQTATAPQNVSVLETGASTALVEWSEPASDGGSSIVSYSVTITALSGRSAFVARSAVCATVIPDATTHTASCSASFLSPGGRYTVSVVAVNAVGAGSAATTEYTVSGALLAISTTSLPNGKVGAAYSQTLVATGGLDPYEWAIESGSLPAGVTLDAKSGAITGTPTTKGAVTFVARVTDAVADTVTVSLTLTMSPPDAVEPGQVVAMMGDEEVQVNVSKNPANTTVSLTGPGFDLAITGRGPDGKPTKLGANDVLTLPSNGKVSVSGNGFRPGSPVNLFLLAPGAKPTPGKQFATVTAKKPSKFGSNAYLPKMPPGPYVLWMEGTNENGEPCLIAVGVEITAGKVKKRVHNAVATFWYRSATLTKSDKKALRALVRQIPTTSRVNVAITGVVQAQNPSAKNKALAHARAKAVKSFLLDRGLIMRATVSMKLVQVRNRKSERRVNVSASFRR